VELDRKLVDLEGEVGIVPEVLNSMATARADWQHPSVDIEAYFERIRYAGDRAPSITTLTALHRAHLSAIPFENLDIQLGRPILLDLPSLEAKLVAGRRGGYCFEQNALFAAVLDELGFAVTRLAARVRLGSTDVRPRTHMVLAVDSDGSQWLADVGFGGHGLLEPIPAAPGEPIDQAGWRFRIVEEGPRLVLRLLVGEMWSDLYAFTLEEHYPADYELGNYYTSTHPQSVFVTTLIAQRVTPDLRLSLSATELTEHRPDAATTTAVRSDDELLEILAERFGLDFPAGTRFPNRARDQGSTPA
jgi:N-hydroxyarylamine O-acetyltransferase